MKVHQTATIPALMSSLTWFDQDIRCDVSALAATVTDTGPFFFLPMRASETSGRTFLSKSCALTPPPVPCILIARLSIRKRPRRRIFVQHMFSLSEASNAATRRRGQAVSARSGETFCCLSVRLLSSHLYRGFVMPSHGERSPS
jgi:hypothetical protein